MRRRDIGTMVAPQPVRSAVALSSLYDDLKEAGREPETCVLAFEEARCPPDIAERLGLEPDAPVLSFDRLRLANSGAHVQITHMHDVLPTGLLKIEEKDLERTGHYELFRRRGIAPHVATQRIGARRAGAEEAEPLEIEPGSSPPRTTRITYDTGGRPIEHGWHRYPAESYWLEMMLVEL
jgi:DNA-binding GntR family transcriptional regulator